MTISKLMLPGMLLAISGLALAQESKPLNLSIRLGQFNPSGGVARDEGKTWFAMGGEYRFKELGVSTSNPGTSSYLTVSLDTYNKGDFRANPLLLNYVTRTNELYFTAGAGITFADEPKDSSRDQTRLGYQLGVGWDFQQGKTPLFVEAKYWGASNNDHFNGIGFYIGIRL